MTKPKRLVYLWIMGLVLWAFPAAADETTAAPKIPTPGMFTMVDLGAGWCVPCKMMEPILAELQKEYGNQVSIILIDVTKHRDIAQRLSVRGIPTQVFFDKDGKEAQRHIGFMDKKSIVGVFEKLGALN